MATRQATLQSGETFANFAARHGTSIRELAQLNPSMEGARIHQKDGYHPSEFLMAHPDGKLNIPERQNLQNVAATRFAGGDKKSVGGELRKALEKSDRVEVELAWVKVDGNYFKGLRGTIYKYSGESVYDPTLKRSKYYYRVTLYGGDKLSSSYPTPKSVPVARNTEVMISIDDMPRGEKAITLLPQYPSEGEKVKGSYFTYTPQAHSATTGEASAQRPAIAAFPASEFRVLKEKFDAESNSTRSAHDSTAQFVAASGRFVEVLKAKQEGRDAPSSTSFKNGDAVLVSEVTLSGENYENVERGPREADRFSGAYKCTSSGCEDRHDDPQVRRFSNLTAKVVGLDPSGKYIVKLDRTDVSHPDLLFHIKEQTVLVEPAQLSHPQVAQKYKAGQTVQIGLTKTNGLTAEGLRGEVAEFNPLTGKYKIKLQGQEVKAYEYRPAWDYSGCTKYGDPAKHYPEKMEEKTINIAEGTIIEVAGDEPPIDYQKKYTGRYTSPEDAKREFVYHDMKYFGNETNDSFGKGLSADAFSTDEQVVLPSGIKIELDPGMMHFNYTANSDWEGIRGKVIGRNQDGSYKVRIENGYQRVEVGYEETARIAEQTVDVPADKLKKFDEKTRDYRKDLNDMGDKEWRRLGVGVGLIAGGALLAVTGLVTLPAIAAVAGAYYAVPALYNLTTESTKIAGAYLYNNVQVVHDTVDALGKAKDGLVQAGEEVAKIPMTVVSSVDKYVVSPVIDSFKKVGESIWSSAAKVFS